MIPQAILYRADKVINDSKHSAVRREQSAEKKRWGEFMRKRGGFGFALCAMLFALCASAQAQQPKKVPRIGYLSPQDPTPESSRAEGIRLALRELGYIEGQNIAIEYRYSEEKADRAPERAAELVRLKVDIIVVAGGTEPVRSAKNATKTIPIVMTGAGLDPAMLPRNFSTLSRAPREPV
jgi:ABC-type uncharacterized transport system substrate-binding protein